MPPHAARSFRRRMAPLMVVSVVAWAAFAATLRAFWPAPTAPGEALGLLLAWLAAGGVAFVPAALGLLRWFRVPPASRAAAAVALSAPALCLDVFTTLFFESWFPGAGTGDDRVYPALIVGGVGAILLMGLLTTRPEETAQVSRFST